MIDIEPPKMPEGSKKIIMMCEMNTETMSDWFRSLTPIQRELIVFDAYMKFNLEEIKKERKNE